MVFFPSLCECISSYFIAFTGFKIKLTRYRPVFNFPAFRLTLPVKNQTLGDAPFVCGLWESDVFEGSQTALISQPLPSHNEPDWQTPYKFSLIFLHAHGPHTHTHTHGRRRWRVSNHCSVLPTRMHILYGLFCFSRGESRCSLSLIKTTTYTYVYEIMVESKHHSNKQWPSKHPYIAPHLPSNPAIRHGSHTHQ